MRAKFTFLARVGGKFTPVTFQKGLPVAPAGSTTFYARFSEDKKRICKPLGNDPAQAYLKFRNMEMVREFEQRHLPVPIALMPEAPVVKGASVATKATEYLETIRETRSRGTWMVYRRSLALAQEFFVDKTVTQITREDLLAFKRFLVSRKLSARSIANNFINVIVFLKWCDVASPLKKGETPRFTAREPEEYTEDQLKALLQCADDDGRLMFKCFLCSGVRAGEMAHLTYGNIDFKHNTFSVRPTEDWKPKTDASPREIPVIPELIEKLRERMIRNNRKETDSVFFRKSGPCAGMPHSSHTMLNILRAAAKCAKLTGRVDDHKFRSTAITRWLAAGNSIQDVMRWVGHVSPETILKNYAAKANVRNPETQRKAARAFTMFASVGD